MGNIDDRYACRLQAAHDLEQGPGLVFGQRGGRLVHDQDLGVLRQRLGDLDHLHHAGAEFGPRCIRIEILAEILQHGARHLSGGPIVQEERTLARLAVEKDVLRHGKRRHQAEFLKDHGDASALGIVGAGDGHRPGFDGNRAGILQVNAGQDLHQRRFASAVAAHQRMHLATPQGEIDFSEDRNGAEGLLDIAHFKDRVAINHGFASHKIDAVCDGKAPRYKGPSVRPVLTARRRERS